MRTHPTTHTFRFSNQKCLKNALNTFFFKLPYFSIYSFFFTSERLPNHLFRQSYDQKWCSLKRKHFFFFKFFSHFPSPLTEKNKTTHSFQPFYHRKWENRTEIRHLNFFFPLFFTLLLPLIEKNYHTFFSEIPTLSAQKMR